MNIEWEEYHPKGQIVRSASAEVDNMAMSVSLSFNVSTKGKYRYVVEALDESWCWTEYCATYDEAKAACEAFVSKRLEPHRKADEDNAPCTTKIKWESWVVGGVDRWEATHEGWKICVYDNGETRSENWEASIRNKYGEEHRFTVTTSEFAKQAIETFLEERIELRRLRSKMCEKNGQTRLAIEILRPKISTLKELCEFVIQTIDWCEKDMDKASHILKYGRP